MREPCHGNLSKPARGEKETMSGLRLIADIGGTNARFAVAQQGRFDHLRVLHTGDYPSLAEAARAYLAGLPDRLLPSRAALAIAGPVAGDRVALTNQNWSFSTAELILELGVDELLVLNDFAAQAMAIPYLAASDVAQIGPGTPVENGPIAIMGPGTGFGMGCLIPEPDGWSQLSSEGGHATMPPATDEESRILEVLRARYGHVSVERTLSGHGLTNLYDAVCDLADVPARPLDPGEVTAEAVAGTDGYCVQALDLFCAMLGTVGGDLALTLCATGGLYIAGGIVPRFADYFAASEFRARFTAKGRLRTYLEAIPTYLILHPCPALLGLANLDAFSGSR